MPDRSPAPDPGRPPRRGRHHDSTNANAEAVRAWLGESYCQEQASDGAVHIEGGSRSALSPSVSRPLCAPSRGQPPGRRELPYARHPARRLPPARTRQDQGVPAAMNTHPASTEPARQRRGRRPAGLWVPRMVSPHATCGRLLDRGRLFPGGLKDLVGLADEVASGVRRGQRRARCCRVTPSLPARTDQLAQSPRCNAHV